MILLLSTALWARSMLGPSLETRRRFGSYHNRIRYCHPHEDMRVTVHFRFETDGRLSVQSVEGTTDEELVSCLERTFSSMRFPEQRFPRRGAYSINYTVSPDDPTTRPPEGASRARTRGVWVEAGAPLVFLPSIYPQRLMVRDQRLGTEKIDDFNPLAIADCLPENTGHTGLRVASLRVSVDVYAHVVETAWLGDGGLPASSQECLSAYVRTEKLWRAPVTEDTGHIRIDWIGSDEATKGSAEDGLAASVQAAIEQRHRALRRCYRTKQWRTMPDVLREGQLHGLELDVVASADGTLSSVAIRASDLNKIELEKCVVSALDGTSLPEAPTQDHIVPVQLRFVGG